MSAPAASLERSRLRDDRWRTTVQEALESSALDVAAGENQSDLLADIARAFLQQRGERCRARAFHDLMGVVEIAAHGLSQLVFAHLHDARRAALDDVKRGTLRLACGDAIGERGGTGGRHGCAGVER